MAKYYDTYKTLILVSAFSGIYFPSVDHLIPWKWLIIVLKGFPIIPFLSQVLFLISQIIFLFDESESFPNKIFSISLIFFSIMSLFPIFFSFLHRNDYTRLFETWDAIFADDEYSKKREVCIYEYGIFIIFFCFFFVSKLVLANNFDEFNLVNV